MLKTSRFHVIGTGALLALDESGFEAACIALMSRKDDEGRPLGIRGNLLVVKTMRGTFKFANSASTDQITLADVGASAYIVDDQTVAKTNGTSTRSIAGTIRDVESDGVWIEI